MHPVSHESVPMLSIGESHLNPKTHVQRRPEHIHEPDEIDLIDLIAFLWRIRQSILYGAAIGLLVGSIYALNRNLKAPSRMAPSSAPTPQTQDLNAFTFKSEFLCALRDEPIDGNHRGRLQLLNELISQPKTLEIFYRTMAQAWPHLPNLWDSQRVDSSSVSESMLLRSFLAKQNEEKIISFQESPTSHGIILALNLPIEVNSLELRSVVEKALDELNNQILIPMHLKVVTANQQAKLKILAAKSELLLAQSRLNKLNYKLIKEFPTIRQSIDLSQRSEVESRFETASIQKVLALVSILSAERLISPRVESAFYRELVDIQAQMEDLPKQLASQISSISINSLSSLQLAPTKDQTGLTLNKAIASPAKDSTPGAVQNKVPTLSPPKQVSASAIVILGLFFGSFGGIVVGGVRLFIKNNWHKIKASVQDKGLNC